MGDLLFSILIWLLVATDWVMNMIGNNIVVVFAILSAAAGILYVTSEEHMGKSKKSYLYGALLGLAYGAVIATVAVVMALGIRWGVGQVFDIFFPPSEVSQQKEAPEETDIGELLSELLTEK